MQYLISAVNQNPKELAEKMNIHADCLMMNQISSRNSRDFKLDSLKTLKKDRETESPSDVSEALNEFCITWKRGNAVCKAWQMREKGVGLSRNHLLMRSSADILLFSDEDIVYQDDCETIVEHEFAEHKEADMILFNVKVTPERKTYENSGYQRVHSYNCGRYPAYSIAVRRDTLLKTGVMFSLLFGGGAKYSNGEDSLFLRQFIQAGGKVYTTEKLIGEEIPRESTWFKGYNEKFFYDRGVLYHFLYKKAAVLWALRFVLTKKKLMCREIAPRKAFALMKKGIRDGGL